MIASVIVACLMTTFQGVTSPHAPHDAGQSPEVHKKEAWTMALRATFKDVTFSVAVDIPDTAPPVTFRPVTYLSESEYLSLFASTLKRGVFQFGNVRVIARSLEASKANTGRRLIADWLDKVPDAEIRKLASGSMAFTELSAPSRALFLGLCTDPGVKEKMSSGQLVTVSLRAAFLAEVGGVSSCINPLDRDSDKEEKIREEVAKTFVPPKPVPWPKYETSGELVFNEGEVLAAKEVIARAVKAFGTTYIFDNRIADNLVYCQGKFDKETFLKVLNTLTIPFSATVTPDTSRDSKVIQDRFKQLQPFLDTSLFPPGLDEDALKGNTVTVDELARLNPTFAKIAERDKRKPNDSVKISAIPCFYAVVTSSKIEDLALRWSMMIRP